MTTDYFLIIKIILISLNILIQLKQLIKSSRQYYEFDPRLRTPIQTTHYMLISAMILFSVYQLIVPAIPV